MPHAPVYPSGPEVSEMAHRAGEVVRLLEELRRMNFGEGVADERAKAMAVDVTATSADGGRPPKRPWEDLGREPEANVRFLLLPAKCVFDF